MNEKVTHSIPLFLNQSKELFEALQKDITVKGRLARDYNFTDQCLADSFALHEKAQLAQTAYDDATATVPETKRVFESRYEEAVTVYRKHAVLLRVALEYNPQKQLDLGLIGRDGENSTPQWIDNRLNSYRLLLLDPGMMPLMARYNLKKQDFENARVSIVAFMNAYRAITHDRPEIKEAIANLDEALGELVDNIAAIQALLLQLFENEPQQFKRYNLPLVYDEIGREIGILMVKDSSITGKLNRKRGANETENTR